MVRVNMLDKLFLCIKLHRKLGLTFYWGRGGSRWVYDKRRSDVFLSNIDLRVVPYKIVLIKKECIQ